MFTLIFGIVVFRRRCPSSCCACCSDDCQFRTPSVRWDFRCLPNVSAVMMEQVRCWSISFRRDRSRRRYGLILLVYVPSRVSSQHYGLGWWLGSWWLRDLRKGTSSSRFCLVIFAGTYGGQGTKWYLRGPGCARSIFGKPLCLTSRQNWKFILIKGWGGSRFPSCMTGRVNKRDASTIIACSGRRKRLEV